MSDLTDKVAIVTGSSRGIGRAIAVELASSGAHIVINGTSRESVESASREISRMGRRSLAHVGNVASPDDVRCLVKSCMDEFSRIDILVNNAGIIRDSLIGSMTDEQWNEVIDVNLKGAFYCIREVARHMIVARYGKIVNISSVVGMTGNEGQANYAAAKAGLIGLTKTAARELARKNITVNVVAPGFIDAGMNAGLNVDRNEVLRKTIPIQRIGRAIDVAEMVKFLVSDASRYVTGQVFKVDGGLSM